MSLTLKKDTSLWKGESMTARTMKAQVWLWIMLAATSLSIILLVILLSSILNNAFGFVILQYEMPPQNLFGQTPVEAVSDDAIIQALRQHLKPRQLRAIEAEQPLETQTRKMLIDTLEQKILNPSVVSSYSLMESLFNRNTIVQESESFPQSVVSFRAWLSLDFLTSSQNSNPLHSGIQGAILGSLWVIIITMITALPIGVGTAIFLSEYLPPSRLGRLVQINIYNLSGVPSIVYGLLGLVTFVRFMEPITSGKIFGLETGAYANGRTIVSAGLTLTLLLLPIIIINAQEAMSSVSRNLRYSSYALGATKWQTIYHHVLPASMARILTGTILALSRAIGETAPLVVIGASTFLTLNPSGLFSKFTVLPIQIYQWASRPQQEFRHLAAATIVVLLLLMLCLNSLSLILRNRITSQQRKLQ